MLKFLGSCLCHVKELYLFRHTGIGLPKEHGGALYALVTIAMVLHVCRFALLGDYSVLLAPGPFLISTGLMMFVLQPNIYAAMLLAGIGEDLLGISARIAIPLATGDKTLASVFDPALSILCLAVLVSTFVMIRTHGKKGR